MAESRFKPQSLNPDTFTTGRPDGFTGTWEGLYMYPSKAKDGKYYANLALVILPDEDTGLDRFMEIYSAGFLNQCVPSKDGISPAGGEDEDFIALSQGKYEGEGLDTQPLEGEFPNQMIIPNHDNVGEHFLGSLSKTRAGYQLLKALQELDEKKVFKELHSDEPSTSLSFANGYRFRFDRVPQKGDDKKKKKEGEEAKNEYKVLVPTAFYGRADAKSSGAKKSTSSTSATSTTSASPSSSSNGSSLETDIIKALEEHLTSTKERKDKRGSFAVKVMKKFPQPQRGEVHAFLTDDENLERVAALQGWEYDTESDDRWLSLGEG